MYAHIIHTSIHKGALIALDITCTIKHPELPALPAASVRPQTYVIVTSLLRRHTYQQMTGTRNQHIWYNVGYDARENLKHSTVIRTVLYK